MLTDNRQLPNCGSFFPKGRGPLFELIIWQNQHGLESNLPLPGMVSGAHTARVLRCDVCICFSKVNATLARGFLFKVTMNNANNLNKNSSKVNIYIKKITLQVHLYTMAKTLFSVLPNLGSTQ